MIFLVPVIFCAVRFGLWPAIAASILSFLPSISFSSNRSTRLRFLSRRNSSRCSYFLLSQSLQDRSRAGFANIPWTCASAWTPHSRCLKSPANCRARPNSTTWRGQPTAHTQKALGAKCVVSLLPEDGELRLAAAWPPLDNLDVAETSAARWALEKAEPAGWRTGTLPNVRFQFRPLVTPRGVVGVCGIEPKNASEPFSSQDDRTLTSILDQTAIAIDRSLLVGESIRAAALEENEKLRTTLLSSLSHDLRTPLASITGAVTSLRELGDKMCPQDRQDLLASIEEESGALPASSRIC